MGFQMAKTYRTYKPRKTMFIPKPCFSAARVAKLCFPLIGYCLGMVSVEEW
jgi:hypothetical protein